MTSPIRTQRHDDVLVVISDNPPVNALGQAVRAGLKDAIDEAIGDDAVKAVVIRCEAQLSMLTSLVSRTKPAGESSTKGQSTCARMVTVSRQCTMDTG